MQLQSHKKRVLETNVKLTGIDQMVILEFQKRLYWVAIFNSNRFGWIEVDVANFLKVKQETQILNTT